MFKKVKAQGSLEYLVILAAVLLVAGVVVFLVTGSAGSSKKDIVINNCQAAAEQCHLLKAANPSTVCDFCEKQCVDKASGNEIFNGAIACCEQGVSSAIYEREGAELSESCYNGVDDNCDGLIDYQDTNCLYSEVIDSAASGSSNDVGGLNVLKLKNDVPFVVYRENNTKGYNILRYAHKVGSSWNSEAAYDNSSERVGTFDLAFDHEGNPHIVFMTDLPESKSMYTNLSIVGYLRHVWKDGSGWHSEIIDDKVGFDPSLVFDGNDFPHFIIGLQNGTATNGTDTINAYHLAHFWKDGSGWHSELIDDNGYNVGHYNSLVIDSKNNLYAAYNNNSVPFDMSSYWHNHKCYLTYAVKPVSAAWNVKPLEGPDAACGYYSRIDLDSSQLPHIVSSCHGILKHYYYDGNNWVSPEEITTGTWSTSFKIDRRHANSLNVVLRWGGTAHPTYFYKKDGVWLSKKLDKGVNNGKSSMQLGSDGYLYYVYEDTNKHELKFIKFKPYSPY